jgi:hypothetical protein
LSVFTGRKYQGTQAIQLECFFIFPSFFAYQSFLAILSQNILILLPKIGWRGII